MGGGGEIEKVRNSVTVLSKAILKTMAIKECMHTVYTNLKKL